MWTRFLQKIVRVLDPKLEKYRERGASSKKEMPKFTPKTMEEFIGVVKRAPKDVLNSKDKTRIAAVMSFDDRRVADLMAPKTELVFVRSDEILGPLILDKLYKSGFTEFPVINSREKVVGVLHTEALNTLEIRKTDKAEKYIDKGVKYLHTNDSLDFVIEEVLRLNTQYFLVLNENEELAGFLTLKMVFDYLLS